MDNSSPDSEATKVWSKALRLAGLTESRELIRDLRDAGVITPEQVQLLDKALDKRWVEAGGILHDQAEESPPTPADPSVSSLESGADPD